MHSKRLSYVWDEAVIWAYVLGAIARDVARVAAVRAVLATLAKCRRYVPHALLVLAACAVSWVLSEWYVEGAFKPLLYFVHQLFVWRFVVVR